MTQKISELVDGELEGHEAAGAYSALQSGVEARDAWFRYHLISDAIHDTRLLSHGFSERVAARLAAEPTVLAPVVRMPARGLPRYAAMAAGLAAVAFVGGITFNFMGEGPIPEVAKAPAPAAAAVAVAAPAPAPPTQAQRDYMLAHQGYSPRNGLLVRVSGKAPNKP